MKYLQHKQIKKKERKMQQQAQYSFDITKTNQQKVHQIQKEQDVSII